GQRLQQAHGAKSDVEILHREELIPRASPGEVSRRWHVGVCGARMLWSCGCTDAHRAEDCRQRPRKTHPGGTSDRFATSPGMVGNWRVFSWMRPGSHSSSACV